MIFRSRPQSGLSVCSSPLLQIKRFGFSTILREEVLVPKCIIKLILSTNIQSGKAKNSFFFQAFNYWFRLIRKTFSKVNLNLPRVEKDFTPLLNNLN